LKVSIDKIDRSAPVSTRKRAAVSVDRRGFSELMMKALTIGLLELYVCSSEILENTLHVFLRSTVRGGDSFMSSDRRNAAAEVELSEMHAEYCADGYIHALNARFDCN
jgi:hypothetical protein